MVHHGSNVMVHRGSNVVVHCHGSCHGLNHLKAQNRWGWVVGAGGGGKGPDTDIHP